MLPVFMTPWAFLGLAALPALVAIYWLRQRFRPVPVSSLMLWADQKEVGQGGLRVRRLQTHLLFLLELLALILLAGAAAGPGASDPSGAQPLVIVLDDSYSMLAGDADSPRRQAETALLEELRRGIRFAARLVLAGEAPQVLGEPVRTAREAAAALGGWRCRAPTARLAEAIALARQIAGEHARILVVSDQAPAFKLESGRMQWWAFGKPRANLAFVNASRSIRSFAANQEGRDRSRLEVANLSSESQKTTLTAKTAEGILLHRSVLTLAAGERRSLVLHFKDKVGTIRVNLGPDELAIDNEVILPRHEPAPARVDLKIHNDQLRNLVEKALAATQRAVVAPTRPHLLLTDKPEPMVTDPETWLVQFLIEKDAAAYLGPFVLDRRHPLTEGVSLQNIVWAAGKEQLLGGTPVILAGNIPLITDSENGIGAHRLRIRLRPDLSTLPETPQWPILLWNLVNWRASHTTGLDRSAVRLGETATLTPAPGVETVDTKAPGGDERRLPVSGRQVVVKTDEVGLHELRAGTNRYSLAVNALNLEESDLSACASGRWGEWADAADQVRETHDYAWVLLLLAALALTIHLMLIGTGKTWFPWSLSPRSEP